MVLKSLFGFCCTKGCHNRADFDVEVKAGNKAIKRKMCLKHTNELVRQIGIENIKSKSR